MRAILDTLNSGTRQLESISTQPILWDQVWIHFAKQRLPKHTLDAWEQYRNRNGSNRLPTLEELKQFLDTKSKGRREFENESDLINQSSGGGKSKVESGGNRFQPYDKNQSNRGEKSYRFRRNDSHRSSGPALCVMSGCNQTHYLGQCTLFGALSLTERTDVTRQHRLCRCCLTPGHMAYTCTRSGCAKCPDAKPKHHFRLCPKTTIDSKVVAPVTKKTEPAKQ